MKKVITYGTFDLLHYGHIRLLERARALGDYLVVAVSSDEFNALKGKTSVFNFDERCKLLSSLKCVDEIIAENSWEQKANDVKEHNISVFTIGDDWAGKFDFLKDFCEVVYLPRTQEISSSAIKQNILGKDK